MAWMLRFGRMKKHIGNQSKNGAFEDAIFKLDESMLFYTI